MGMHGGTLYEHGPRHIRVSMLNLNKVSWLGRYFMVGYCGCQRWTLVSLGWDSLEESKWTEWHEQQQYLRVCSYVKFTQHCQHMLHYHGCSAQEWQHVAALLCGP